ncbi:MAG: cytochrome c3 family protein [Thermodesulfovibrionia bacterium]|nr:cytochrome c3 family protein [Thermodesulfovibrionia bacterium]
MNKTIFKLISLRAGSGEARKFSLIFAFMLALHLIFCSYSHAEIKLKAKEPASCYKCHNELKERLSDNFTHFLFKQGKCSTCHNPHVSKDRGLIRGDINPLCLGCHDSIEKLVNNARQHSAIRDGLCTGCHDPHSSKNKGLIKKDEKEMCLECHEDLKLQLERAYACRPFKKGECSACHNAHGSQEANLLIGEPGKTCKKCHTLINCKAGNVSISSVTRNMNCISCHSGHSSDEKGVLGPYGHKMFISKECDKCHKPFSEGGKITTKLEGEKLCLSCHKEDSLIIEADVHGKDSSNSCSMCHTPHSSNRKEMTVDEGIMCTKCHLDTEKRTVFMEKALKSERECAPIKNRQCFECHVPKHSSRKLNFREDEFILCNECHETQHKITHPLGPDVIDVRNGQPITCISCHSMHAAKAQYMLTHDGKRTLCIQCHKY